VNNQPRVVIIGGGFGGLNAARGLAGAPISVTLIDKRNYHLFRPMLYQVATGLLSADQISGPLRSILSRQANVEVLMDEVGGVDTDRRLVRLKQHSISYDYLVLATGIQYNYFGHDEWRRLAPGLESLDDGGVIASTRGARARPGFWSVMRCGMTEAGIIDRVLHTGHTRSGIKYRLECRVYTR
jgi:NADH dehydrogenase